MDSIDRDGLHLLVDCSSAERCVDIVFVHGLGGASHSTWKNSNGFFWPEELGRDLRRCRVWTLGYPAGFLDLGKPGMLIDKRAGNLAHKLANAGLDKGPIIFVTHSMGGLVVKALVAYAELSADTARRRIAKNVRGLVFCATPHRGSEFANACTSLGWYFNGAQAHVKEMRQNADAIDLLHERFLEWHKANPISVASYAENIGLFRKKLFGRLLPMWPFVRSAVVVPRASANTGVGTFLDVDDDHLSLVKPEGRQHDIYMGVLRFSLPIMGDSDADPADYLTTPVLAMKKHPRQREPIASDSGPATRYVLQRQPLRTYGLGLALAVFVAAVILPTFSETLQVQFSKLQSKLTVRPAVPAIPIAKSLGDSTADGPTSTPVGISSPDPNEFALRFPHPKVGDATPVPDSGAAAGAGGAAAMATEREHSRWVSNDRLKRVSPATAGAASAPSFDPSIDPAAILDGALGSSKPTSVRQPSIDPAAIVDGALGSSKPASVRQK